MRIREDGYVILDPKTLATYSRDKQMTRNDAPKVFISNTGARAAIRHLGRYAKKTYLDKLRVVRVTIEYHLEMPAP